MRIWYRGLLPALGLFAATGCSAEYKNKVFQSYSIELMGPLTATADPFLATNEYQVTLSYFEDAEGTIPYGKSLSEMPNGFEKFSPVSTQKFPGTTKRFNLGESGALAALPPLSENQAHFFVAAEVVGRDSAGEVVARARCPVKEIKVDPKGDLGPVVCHPFFGSPGQWSTVASLNQPREQFAAARLQDGRVLVVGGRKPGEELSDASVLANAEIFDPNGGGEGVPGWKLIKDGVPPRVGMTATVRADGRVVVTGGSMVRPNYPDPGVSLTPSNATIIFDPSTDTFVPLGTSELTPRAQHAAGLLNGTTVLVAGGVTVGDSPISGYYERISGSTTLASSQRQAQLGERRSPCILNIEANKALFCSGEWSNGTVGGSSCVLFTAEQARSAGASIVGRSETLCAMAGSTPIILGGEAPDTTPQVDTWNTKSFNVERWGKPPFSYPGQAIGATGSFVLVSGGTTTGETPVPIKKAYLIDVAKGRGDPKLIADMGLERSRHQLVGSADGTIMAVGGSASGVVEIFVVPDLQ
jgi:hypothetical protein